jgi:ribosomal protein S12 methylthiotransferase
VIAVGLVSLGCAKNLVDSEVMLGLLRRRGFEVTHQPRRADVIVVNTCGFLDAAREESYASIREMGLLKSTGRCRRLVVAGCLVQRSLDRMREELPEVDQFMALNDLERIVEACDLAAEGFAPDTSDAVYQPDERAPRLLTDSSPSAYLKISEGCDNPCSFCVIPRIRGSLRSRSVDSLVMETRNLVEAGVREINLIAQDTTSYGADIGYEPGLPGLLSSLSSVEGARWIRVLYAYPNRLSEKLAEVMAGSPGILPYLDLPLQHASRSVLAGMKRGGSRESFTRIIGKLRRAVPGLSLRSTFIVGFPGESEADFEELRAFVEEVEFDHLGLFTYSHEPGAPSHELADDVPEALKLERRQILQDLQEGISQRLYRSRIGQTLPVLLEGPGSEAGTWTGRAAFQAPEVDGEVLFRCDGAMPTGPFVDVRVEDSLPYALLGRADSDAAREPGFTRSPRSSTANAGSRRAADSARRIAPTLS